MSKTSKKDKKPKIDWDKIELQGDEGKILSDWFSYFLSSRNLDYHIMILNHLRSKRIPYGTMSIRTPLTKSGYPRVDYREFCWSPKFVRLLADIDKNNTDKSRSRGKAKMVLTHEALHVLLMHDSRYYQMFAGMSEDHRKLLKGVHNWAADFETNHYLLTHGYWNPKNHPYDPIPGMYAWDMELEPGKPYEYYVWEFIRLYEQEPQELLKKIKKSGEGDGEGDGDNSDGDQTGDGSCDGGDTQDENGKSSGKNGKNKGGGNKKSGKKSKNKGRASKGGPSEDNADNSGQSQGGFGPSEEDIDNMSDSEAQEILDRIFGKQGEDTPEIPDGASAEQLNALGRMIEQETKAMANKAAQVYQRQRGTLPGDVTSMLNMINLQTPQKWTAILKRFVATGVTKSKAPSWVFPSYGRAAMVKQMKKQGFTKQISMFPGKQKAPTPKVMMIIDTSGSVRDEELMMALTEVNSIVEDAGAELIVITCDTQVRDVIKVEEVGDVVKKGFKGRGGTTMDPAFALFREHNADLVICYTDGGLHTPKIDPRPPSNAVIWLITPTGTKPWNYDEDPYGNIIRINDV